MNPYFYLALMLSGGLGVLCRYLLGRFAAQYPLFEMPLGTLAVNLIGCFLIGYLSVSFGGRIALSPTMQTIVLSGFLGGFTTFSAFSLEAATLLQEGASLRALVYVIVQVVVCLVACFAGIGLART